MNKEQHIENLIGILKFLFIVGLMYVTCVVTPEHIRNKYGTIYCHYDMIQGGIKVNEYIDTDLGNHSCRKSWNYDGMYYKFTYSEIIK